MIHNPLLYTLIYYKIRAKRKGSIEISKREFRSKLVQPLGINKKTSEFVLRDMERYHMIKEIGKGKNGRITLHSITGFLLSDMIELKEKGLI